MLSWLSSSRAGLSEGDNADTTSMEVPETPAHLFAVRAFKQALFGTPQPVTPFIPKTNGMTFQNKSLDTNAQPNDSQKLVPQKRAKASLSNSKAKQQDEKLSSAPASSPVKPPGILMTPGTAASRRKQVKFGEKVVDNEGKSTKNSLSGLPDHYPGKFPSPWTPKVTTAPDMGVESTGKARSGNNTLLPTNTEKRLESRFKEALSLDATQSSKSNAASRTLRVKDDSDITTDISLPTSVSGRYWKDQYETYSKRSEAELNRLITKHRVAKDYAKMKDEEVTALKARLEIDRNKRLEREENLEKQIKTLRERLRVTMAENAKMAAELSLLRNSNDPSNYRLEKLSSPPEISNKIRADLLEAGFKDVKIPISKDARRNSGIEKSLGNQKVSSNVVVPESSGQDIWLDHDDEEDNTYRQRRQLVKSTPLPTRFTNSYGNRSNKDTKINGSQNNEINGFDEEIQAPMSSKSIVEKLTNPLAMRSANIIGKQPSTTGVAKYGDMIDFADISRAPVARSSTPLSRTRGKSPRTAEGKSSESTISEKRKDNAMERIEQRRKNKRESRLGRRKVG